MLPNPSDPKYRRFAMLYRKIGDVLASEKLTNDEVANVLIALLMTIFGPERAGRFTSRAVVMDFIQSKLDSVWPPDEGSN
jgi:hypothetical protein